MTILALIALCLSVLAGVRGTLTTTTVPFSKAAWACAHDFPGQYPINITSLNWARAQTLYGNLGDKLTPPAWIWSWNGDYYDSGAGSGGAGTGACIAFYGGTINVPSSCSINYPVLCDTPTSTYKHRMGKRLEAQDEA